MPILDYTQCSAVEVPFFVWASACRKDAMYAHHLKPIKASGTDRKETRDISVRTWWPPNIGQIAYVIVICTSVTACTSVSFPTEQQLTANCQHHNIKNTRHCHQTRTSSPYRRSAFGYRSYTSPADVGFCTQQTCETYIDYVVSLKDAHQSRASGWSSHGLLCARTRRL